MERLKFSGYGYYGWIIETVRSLSYNGYLVYRPGQREAAVRFGHRWEADEYAARRGYPFEVVQGGNDAG